MFDEDELRAYISKAIDVILKMVVEYRAVLVATESFSNYLLNEKAIPSACPDIWGSRIQSWANFIEQDVNDLVKEHTVELFSDLLDNLNAMADE